MQMSTSRRAFFAGPRASLTSSLILALGLVTLVACEEGLVGTGDEDDLLTISELVITAAETELVEGGTSHFQAQARTSAGVAVDTATITWTSRDESVATVGASTGTVTAVMDGETYIIAETGSGDALLTDSVLVTVSMPEVTSMGQAEFRIRGDMTGSYSWNTGAADMVLVVEESLAPDAAEAVAWLDVEGEEPIEDMEVGLYGFFPQTSEFTPGPLDLPPSEVTNEDFDFETLDGPMLIWYQETDEDGLFYVSTGGTITIESVDGEPGNVPDHAAETFISLEMTAAGYLLDWNTEEFTPTGEEVQIKGRMGVAYFRDLIGYATIQLTGQLGLDVEARVDAFASGTVELDLWWGESTESQSTYVNFDVHLADPGTGTFAIDSIGPWHPGESHMNYVDGDYHIYDYDIEEYTTYWWLPSHEGTIAVDQYGGLGEIIEGTVSVTLGTRDHLTCCEYHAETIAQISFIAPVESADSEWSTAALRSSEQDQSALSSLLRRFSRAERPAER